MAVEVLMPALSPTMEEGTLAKWLVKEGDGVKSGQIIAENETDQATTAVEGGDGGVGGGGGGWGWGGGVGGVGGGGVDGVRGAEEPRKGRNGKLKTPMKTM